MASIEASDSIARGVVMRSLLASSEVAKRRIGICLVCEHLYPFVRQCSKCGCLVPVKVRLEAASCPEGKW